MQDETKMDAAIMWVPTVPNGYFNHNVPLIEPLDNSLLHRNSENCEIKCNRVAGCAFSSDMPLNHISYRVTTAVTKSTV